MYAQVVHGCGNFKVLFSRRQHGLAPSSNQILNLWSYFCPCQSCLMSNSLWHWTRKKSNTLLLSNLPHTSITWMHTNHESISILSNIIYTNSHTTQHISNTLTSSPRDRRWKTCNQLSSDGSKFHNVFLHKSFIIQFMKLLRKNIS